MSQAYKLIPTGTLMLLHNCLRPCQTLACCPCIWCVSLAWVGTSILQFMGGLCDMWDLK